MRGRAGLVGWGGKEGGEVGRVKEGREEGRGKVGGGGRGAGGRWGGGGR